MIPQEMLSDGSATRSPRRMFLYGDVADNFAQVSAPFIEAAGGHDARIALLTQGGPDWKKWVPEFSGPWHACGVGEVVPIVPDSETLELYPDDIFRIRDCTGVFISGGDTGIYRRVYTQPQVRVAICEMYSSGVPFGGVSAGAMIASATCIIWGAKVQDDGNEYWVQAPLPEMRNMCQDTQVDLGEGLGLLDCVVDTHLSERGRLPRLLSMMAQTGARTGLGLDEAASVEIEDETMAVVRGRGKAYLLQRTNGDAFEVRALSPGAGFQLRP